MRAHANVSLDPPLSTLRHNNLKRLSYNRQPGNASAPTEPVNSVARGEIRPESETGNYKGRALFVSSDVGSFSILL